MDQDEGGYGLALCLLAVFVALCAAVFLGNLIVVLGPPKKW